MAIQIYFLRKSHKFYMWMASFLNELIQYAHSEYVCKKKFCYKHYIGMAFFWYELIQYGSSEFLVEKQ